MGSAVARTVDGIVNIRGKGGRTRVVGLSRGTWAELQALRPFDALGDDRVFPITAWNAWDRCATRRAGPGSRRINYTFIDTKRPGETAVAVDGLIAVVLLLRHARSS